MSTTMEEEFKRWTAKRKTQLVLDILQGRTTVAEASRTFDLAPSEIEEWVEDGRKGMENALRTKPLDIKEHYERQIRELQEAYGEAMLQMRVLKKVSKPAGGRRKMMSLARQAAAEEGATVSTARLCEWFDIPRRSAYYQSRRSAPKAQAPLCRTDQRHGLGTQLRAEAGVHHAALSATKWDGRAGHSYVERAMRTPPSIRDAAACQSWHRRLDRLLQLPAPASGAGHENTR